MKKQLLILAFACIGLSAKAQTNLFPDFLNQTKQVANHQQNTMAKAGLIYKPGTQINYNWDITANDWTFQDSTIKTYNSAGNVITLLSYYDGFTTNKIVYMYNTKGKEIADSTYNWIGTTYDISSYTAFTYDAFGNNTKQLTQYWNNSTWVNSSEINYTYDANGNRTEYLNNSSWNGTSWDGGYKTNYTWSNGQIIGEISQNYNGSAWVNSVKLDYTYTSGKITGVMLYNWNGTSWVNNRNLINVVWYAWVGNIQNGINKLASYTVQVPNGAAWKDTLKYTNTYDSYGNGTDWLEQAKPAANWITSNIRKHSYLYDANSNITQDIEQDWVDATIGLRNYYKTVYHNYNAYSTALTPIANTNSALVIYPNPATGIINLLTNKNITSLEVFDIMGKLVYSKANNSHETNLQIDLSAFNNGIYLIYAQAENGEMTKSKVIISK